MKKEFLSGFIVTALLICAVPARAEEACAKTEACGPGEVKLPFMQALQQEKAAVAALPAAKTAAKKTPSSAAAPVKFAQVPAGDQPKLQLFYTYDCPHCRDAIQWLPELQKAYPRLLVEKYEVKRLVANRQLLAEGLAARGAKLTGFPTFILGKTVITGFSAKHTPADIKGALEEVCGCPVEKGISVPVLGKINPSSVSLFKFSLVLGLLDGLNPCAMWVLMFLMGLLVYTRSTKRMLLIGGVFTAASAIVYFAFMAAWFNLFTVIGHAGWITAGLGAVAVIMGLVNLKEIFFFKQGVSLMIADSNKQKLAARIRAIMGESRTAAMLGGTVLLAFFVNLIELGCTIGLPAIFTRVLSIREAGPAQKYMYMAIYNIAYIVPLAAIVAIFVLTMGRYKMTENHGKILKGISGALMLALGLLMLLKPEALMLK